MKPESLFIVPQLYKFSVKSPSKIYKRISSHVCSMDFYEDIDGGIISLFIYLHITFSYFVLLVLSQGIKAQYYIPAIILS